MKKRLDRDHGIFASLAMTIAISVLGSQNPIDNRPKYMVLSVPIRSVSTRVQLSALLFPLSG
jgi:hypothetical protein